MQSLARHLLFGKTVGLSPLSLYPCLSRERTFQSNGLVPGQQITVRLSAYEKGGHGRAKLSGNAKPTPFPAVIPSTFSHLKVDLELEKDLVVSVFYAAM